MSLYMLTLTVKPIGRPLPAGLLIPGPAAIAAAPPGALAPSLAAGSAGGSDSTDRDIICAPRTMVRPNVRFSSDSTSGAVELPAPGAAAFALTFLFTRLNSSVSASTRFMCYTAISLHSMVLRGRHTLSKASICPTICLPSFIVTLIR
jgi:hypothetical protein